MANSTAEKTEYSMTLRGRKRIYTDEWYVDERNVLEVLQRTSLWHEQNAQEMRFLLQYEKGYQPLKRTKTVRKDVNTVVCDNIANQVTEFKCSYVWGNPILYVQRGNKDLSGSDESVNSIQDIGITQLNEMNEIEYAPTKDQELARFVEICGLGYQMVDIRPKYDGLSAFDLMTLNPLFTYCVYRNNARQDKVMGVTFHRDVDSGDVYYSVFTPERRYEIMNQTQILNEITGQKEKVDKWTLLSDSRTGLPYFVNPFGYIPIVEFNRSPDRTGCFERQISAMDALNIEMSDFVNLFSQTVQEIWWGVDFDLPVDENGKPKKAENGQWIMTKSVTGGKPDLKPLHSEVDFDGIQQNIEQSRDIILQKCFVPLQTEPGSGSTGTAMSLSSGWSSAEAAAQKEEQMLFRGKMEVVQLEIIAINKITGIEEDSPLKALKPSDVKPQFTRNKTYDLVSKVNAMVTMIKSGIHGRVAMETVNLFPDVAQAWADSKEMVEKFQDSLVNKQNQIPTNDRAGIDATDQIGNSPIVNTYPGGEIAMQDGGEEP